MDSSSKSSSLYFLWIFYIFPVKKLMDFFFRIRELNQYKSCRFFLTHKMLRVSYAMHAHDAQQIGGKSFLLPGGTPHTNKRPATQHGLQTSSSYSTPLCHLSTHQHPVVCGGLPPFSLSKAGTHQVVTICKLRNDLMIQFISSRLFRQSNCDCCNKITKIL